MVITYMAEKLWTSYDSQRQLTFSDKLLVSCSNETKNTTMNDIYNYICSSSGSTGDYQYRINANLVGGIPVTSNTPNDGAILQYNSTYQRWDLIYLTNAGKIRDINVSPATPTDGQVLVYSESGSQYYPADIGGTYTLPTASTTELGGVKIDGTTITIDANGVVSATVGASTWSTITGKPFTSFGTSISVVDGVADVADDGHNHVISNVDGLQDALDGKVNAIEGKGLSTEDYTSTEKTKLENIAENANNYTLPNATTSVLGGIKPDGTTITVDINGVATALGGGSYTLPVANSTTLGGVKVGTNLNIDENGVLSATGGGGLSAYASAQLGGYTDTEAAFYADLAAMQGLDAALEALL
jgi:hypothetical protein